MQYVWSLVLVCLWAGCSSPKAITNSQDNTISRVEFDEDKSLIIQLVLFPDHVTLKRIKILNSPFKPLSQHVSQNDLIKLEFLTSEKQLILEKIANNPLIQYQEYPDDDGTLSRVRINKESTSMLIRTPYTDTMRWLRISYGNDKTFNYVSTVLLDYYHE